MEKGAPRADRDFKGRQPHRLRPLRLGSGGDPRERRARLPEVQEDGGTRAAARRALHGDQLRPARARRLDRGEAVRARARDRGHPDADRGRGRLVLGLALVVGWCADAARVGAGIGVERLSVYEVPFMVTPEATRPTRTTASGSMSSSRPMTAAGPSTTSFLMIRPPP